LAFLDNLMLGLQIAGSWTNLLYAFGGAALGTLIGLLPGLGPLATIAMLLPLMYGLDVIPGLILLAGIYYGAQYGGSTTAILINVPGEASSVVTSMEGYRMAQRGRAGSALAVAALGSFFAGCLGTALLAALAPRLAGLALSFGPAEHFSLMVLGLACAVLLSSGPLLKTAAMVILGLLLGQVNTDVVSGLSRFTFGLTELNDGIPLVVLAMGLFGLGEIVANLGQSAERSPLPLRVEGLRPTREEWRQASPAILRGTVLGALLGILPGAGALLSSFASYALEKSLRRKPGEAGFGEGNIRGVAGPESANNAAAQTAFIPLLTLGIPPNPVMSLMIGAMLIAGVQPGPQVMTNNPELFWGLVVSMWIGNLMLVILNLPLIRLWVRLLTVPYRFIYPAVTVFCCIGAYTLNNAAFDVFLMAGFALVGYVLLHLGCPPAPLLLGFILGPMMEENLRRALILARGDWLALVSRPMPAGFLLMALSLCAVFMIKSFRHSRRGPD